MVRDLTLPARPLPTGAARTSWRWRSPTVARPWLWCRVYHRSAHTPTGDTARRYGPLARFDPHTPPFASPADDPVGRTVLYVGADLATSACEVFGETGEVRLCPGWRVALLRPDRPLSLLDLTAPGCALAIGALPALADGPLARELTQAWARAIYEDRPAGPASTGVRYRSAYNGGLALAVWDSAAAVSTVRAAGVVQDFALTYPPILARLLAAMGPRHIDVTSAPASACRQCARA